MIDRTLARIIINDAGKMPVVTIMGPRQSGKTTLVKHSFPQHQYINLEDSEWRQLMEIDPKGVLADPEGHWIIDEVQRLPTLLATIQVVVDQRKVPGQFILTGSQNILLKSSVAQSLAGRTAIRYLLPLSYSELYPNHTGLKPSAQYIHSGFYPALYDGDVPAHDWLSWYIQTYIERDVQALILNRNWQKFNTFLRLCAGRAGQLINSTNLANETGIDYKTIQSWLDILELSFIIYRLYPYHENYNKRIIKTPKLYFYDTGLLSYLLGLHQIEDIRLHYQYGQLFENLVLGEFKKQLYHNGFRESISFWRSRSGMEIDILLGSGEKQAAFEIKSTATYKNTLTKNLRKWQEITQNPGSPLTLIYDGELDEGIGGLRIMNWRKINLAEAYS